MKPIGLLMIEHRLIERMVAQVKQELARVREGSQVDVEFIDIATDFFRTYADRCHHGKEEDILFRALAGKSLSQEHSAMMHELIDDHVLARKTVTALADAKERYVSGDTGAVSDIMQSMDILVRLYPAHIEKEDKHFFLPCMDYFSKQEQDAMLQSFWEFDRGLIHEIYKSKVALAAQAKE